MQPILTLWTSKTLLISIIWFAVLVVQTRTVTLNQNLVKCKQDLTFRPNMVLWQVDIRKKYKRPVTNLSPRTKRTFSFFPVTCFILKGHWNHLAAAHLFPLIMLFSYIYFVTDGPWQVCWQVCVIHFLHPWLFVTSLLQSIDYAVLNSGN